MNLLYKTSYIFQKSKDSKHELTHIYYLINLLILMILCRCYFIINNISIIKNKIFYYLIQIPLSSTLKPSGVTQSQYIFPHSPKA